MTRHILKIAAVQTSKGRLAEVTLINKYKALREIDGGQSCIAAAKKFGVAKNSFTPVKRIFEAVEGNNVSKRGNE